MGKWAHDFDALEYLARLLTHVPDFHGICVRYYGANSERRRAGWRQQGILDATLHNAYPYVDAEIVRVTVRWRSHIRLDWCAE